VSYGYVTVDGGPHPNPRKAVKGYRLRMLALDEPTEVVRRIFAAHLEGFGDRGPVSQPTSRRTRQDAWPAFARLVEANNGVGGGCWFPRQAGQGS
jgi:hypothetical protein